jgi:hypothetical protein
MLINNQQITYIAILTALPIYTTEITEQELMLMMPTSRVISGTMYPGCKIWPDSFMKSKRKYLQNLRDILGLVCQPTATRKVACDEKQASPRQVNLQAYPDSKSRPGVSRDKIIMYVAAVFPPGSTDAMQARDAVILRGDMSTSAERLPGIVCTFELVSFVSHFTNSVWSYFFLMEQISPSPLIDT